VIHRALPLVARRLRAGTASPAEADAARELVSAYLARPDLTDEDTRLLAAAFEALWQPRTQPVPEPPEPLLSTIRDQFHRLYYHVSQRTWKDTWYRGVLTYKCPTDMWVYQELIDELRPGLVIETGTFRGGSALFVADRLEIRGHGEVVTIDIDVQPDRPEHPRLTYLTGSSVSEEVLAEVRRRVPSDAPVLVILDSDHSQAHVAAELRAYAPLVPVGSYVVVEDTNVNGHPAAPQHGPGPWEAVQEFLAEDPGFEPDPRCERYFLTQNPSGYLRRVRQTETP
jgi:cephalosporin hydroxylase